MNGTSGASSTVVLGEFDGFHRGHQRLMAAARGLAERHGEPLVAVVLDYAARSRCLMQADTRAMNALRLGATTTHVLDVPAEPIRDITAVVARHVHEVTRPARVVMACSPFVADSEVWQPSLAAAIGRYGTPVVQVERPWSNAGQVSSTAVIDALGQGDVERATELLDHRPTIGGEVVRGAGLGHTLGFATANIEPPDRLVIPAPGVYAAAATRAGDRHMAAVNIGRRPTVESHGRLLVEAHLLDFDDDLYHQRLDLEFHTRLRAERRFDGLDQLVAQLGRDVQAVRHVFRGGPDFRPNRRIR